MKQTAKKALRLLPWLMLACVFCFTFVFFIQNARHNMDSDIAGEMMLANLCNEEHVLSLTDSWFYSTELRIVGSTPFLKLGLMVFPNDWMNAQAVGVALFLVLYLVSILFMANACGFKKTAPWLATLLFMPFCSNYTYIVLYGMSYAMHMFIAFTSLGLLGLFTRKHEQLPLPARVAIFAALAILGFWGGANGVRMLTMVFGPVGLAALVLLLVRMGKHEQISDALHDSSFRLFGAVIALCAGALLGYAWFVKFLGPRFPMQNYGGMQVGGFSIEGLWDQFDRFLSFFEYYGLENFFSLHGLGCYLTILIVALVVFVPFFLLSRLDRLPPVLALIVLTALIAVALGMVLNITLEMLYVRYYMFGVLLMILSVFVFFETTQYRCAPVLYVLMTLYVGLFGYKSLEYVREEMHTGPQNYEIAAEWLLENGYTQGYASFWNAGVLTLASSNQIEVWSMKYVPISPDAEPPLWQNLQLRRHMQELPEGPIFVLVDELEAGNNWAALDEAHLVGEDIAWSYTVYAYDSVDAMLDLIASAPHVEIESALEEE